MTSDTTPPESATYDAWGARAHGVGEVGGREHALSLGRQHQAPQQLLHGRQQRAVVPRLPLQPVVARLDRRDVLFKHAYHTA